MSPRRTQTLHDVRYGQHLCPIVFVGFEDGHLFGECLFVMSSLRCLDQRCADRLGPSHTLCFELHEGTKRFAVETYRYCLYHRHEVYHDLCYRAVLHRRSGIDRLIVRLDELSPGLSSRGRTTSEYAPNSFMNRYPSTAATIRVRQSLLGYRATLIRRSAQAASCSLGVDRRPPWLTT